ncbi:uronyl 2-sulfotransferase homolog pip-like [Oratosquilla oratoria]|uniref:uronyl 2-sulfotransferase homolog pip-like n=1 Tax=Oratosquilla oratoria TaxID=337810 RepID=UPI003F75EE91
MMHFRSRRMSDLVTAVCLPTTLVLYLHLLVISPGEPPSSAGPPSVSAPLSLPSSPGLSPVPSSSGHNVRQPPSSASPSPQGPPLRNYVPLPASSSYSPTTSVRVPPPLNISGSGHQDLVLVTTLLRCGTTTLSSLLRALRKTNNFTLVADPPRKAELVHIPSMKVQKMIAERVFDLKEPSAVMQTFSFINYTRLGYAPTPLQVSLIRDPVERAISWFYHYRAPFSLVERHNRFPETKLPTRAYLKKDLESCLRDRNDAECRYVPGRQTLGHTIEFFCGHTSDCTTFGDEEALRKAKATVESSFAVVGVLEDMNKTLAVLEHYVPRFFSGATKAYYDRIHGNQLLTNQNFYKPRVETHAREFLRRNFSVELEFYNFCRQRLDQQYRALQLDIST